MFVLVLFLTGTLAAGSPVLGFTAELTTEIVACVQNDTCILYPSGCDGNDKLCCYSGFDMNCFCCFSTTTIGVTVTSSSSDTPTTSKTLKTTTTIRPTTSTSTVESSSIPTTETVSTTKVTYDTSTNVVTVEASSDIVVPIICSISAVVSALLMLLSVILWKDALFRIRFIHFFCACLNKRTRYGSFCSQIPLINRVQSWVDSLEADRFSDRGNDVGSSDAERIEYERTRPVGITAASETGSDDTHFERTPSVEEIHY